MASLAEWLAAELDASPLVVARVDACHDAIYRDRRSVGGPACVHHTWAERYPSVPRMLAAVASARHAPARAYGWDSERTKSGAACEPLDEVGRLAHGLEADTRRFLGPAGNVHMFYGVACGSIALESAIPSQYAELQAPVGAGASSAAAHLSGADHATPGARQAAHRRAFRFAR